MRLKAIALGALLLATTAATSMPKYSTITWFFSSPAKTVDTITGYRYFGCMAGNYDQEGRQTLYTQQEILLDCSQLGEIGGSPLASCFDAPISMSDTKKCVVKEIDYDRWRYCEATDWKEQSCVM